MSSSPRAVPTDAALRLHHDFVSAFEMLRKSFAHREMGDEALRHVAEHTGLAYEDLRVARHLRNAVAHDEPVNETTLREYLAILTTGERTTSERNAAERQPAPSNGERRASRIHAWRDPTLEQRMLANGYISMGGEEIGDLSRVEDPELIREELAENMPDRTPIAIGIFVGYWKRFLWEAKLGDLVVLPTRDKAVVVGELVGPYFYASADPRSRHRREVSWIGNGIERSDLGLDLLRMINGKNALQEFKQADAAQRLLAISKSGIDPGR